MNTFDPILDAARHLIIEHGHQSLTLDTVAAEAGVPLSTVTDRYPTTVDLLRGLLTPLHAALNEAVLRTPIRLAPTIEDKRRLVEAIVDVSLANRFAYALTLQLANFEEAELLGPGFTEDVFRAGGIRLIGPDFESAPGKRIRVLAAFGAVAHLMGSRMQVPIGPVERAALVDGLVAMLDF